MDLEDKRNSERMNEGGSGMNMYCITYSNGRVEVKIKQRFHHHLHLADQAVGFG